MTTIREERQGHMLGVPGRFTGVTIGGEGYRDGTFTLQRFITESRPFTGPGAQKGEVIRAEIRFDDQCRNGHNTFSITGDTRIPGRRDVEMCGCIHDEIAAHFPELADLIKWHLVSSDGPLHMVANTVYHASDRDHYGRAAGEPSRWEKAIQFGANPIKHKVSGKFFEFLEAAAPHNGRTAFDFEVLPHYHDDHGKPGRHQFRPKFTFGGFAEKWHQCPFDTEDSAVDFLEALQKHDPKFLEIPTQFSEGKKRDLDAARSTAVWPDATDAELMCSKAELTAKLQARLPALMAPFQADIMAAGLLWDLPA